MASFEVKLARSAERELLAVPFPARRQLNQAILRLRTEPTPEGARPIDGEGAYSWPVHGWRLLYNVDAEARTVRLLAVVR